MKCTLTAIVTFLIVASICCFSGPLRSRSDAAENGPGTMPTTLPYPTATFGGGCFWGTESAFRKVPGVLATEVGYSGGTSKDPTYQDVCTHSTGHAECVRVSYDPAKISYAELLDAFWTSHDPTTVDRQGPDVGSNYRSVIFYNDAEQERLAKASVKEVEDSHAFKNPIVTQILPAVRFYRAEEYHQQYFEKQGQASFCHVGPKKVHTKLAEAAAAQRKAATSQPVEGTPGMKGHS